VTVETNGVVKGAGTGIIANNTTGGAGSLILVAAAALVRGEELIM
jgi:hypothetical protein